jgi:hypothetical protein
MKIKSQTHLNNLKLTKQNQAILHDEALQWKKKSE